jgi:hypothetical protein
MAHRQLPEDELLVSLAKLLTPNEIARVFRCTDDAVRRHLSRLNLVAKSPIRLPEIPGVLPRIPKGDQARMLIRQGFRDAPISRRVGLTRERVRQIRKKMEKKT